MQINADGTGSYIDILNDEQDTFSWQIIDSNLVLNHNSDNSTDTLYFIKNINVGYQFLDQGNDSEGDYVDAGMFVKRNEVAINTGNFSGRHRFREGHEIDSHWSEIQIYDDGEIFFTFSTSSFQGSFVNNRYIRRLYVDTSSGGWETTDFCDTSLDTCFLYGEFVYKLIAIDGARYFVERTVAFDDNGTGVLEKFSANLYVHDYASSTAVDKFYDYNLYSFTLYESDGTTWSLSEQDYNEDSQSYDYSLTIGDQSITGVQLVDGKLSFIENGQDTLLELISNNRTELVFCKYLAGNSCQSQDQVSLSMSN